MASIIRDYDQLASQILDKLGGESNIENVTRCATRLRVVTKHRPENVKESISSLTGVITVVDKGGQLQIVIGTNVDKVYDAFVKLVNLDTLPTGGSEQSILNRIIASMSAVFAPFVYILAAAGLIQGGLILVKWVFPYLEQTDTFKIFNFISWAPFVFLPVFIAITASKFFRTNTFIAVACCVALVSPDWAAMAALIKAGGSVTFFGIPLSQTVYTSSVLPPLFLVWILSYLERFLNRCLNDVVKPVLCPMLCLLILVPAALVIIGPLTSGTAFFVASSYNWLAETMPWLAGTLVGGLWQVLVIFGVHWGFAPVFLANFEHFGRDSFQAYITFAVIGQIASVLAFFFFTKNKELKKVSFSAFLTGIFGITEPIIYGINLRFKKPFLYGCCAGIVGGFIASFFTPYYFAYAGLVGPLTIVNGYNINFPTSIIGIAIGSIVSFIIPFILMLFFGTGEKKDALMLAKEEEDKQQELADDKKKIIYLNAPIIGEIKPLSEVPDEVFANKLMGEGIAIEPKDNHVYAPCSGKILTLFNESKHAIGIISDDGVEILIHVGLDTVKITNPPAFEYHVKLEQSVNQGDLLMTFDMDRIRQANCPLITPIIIINSLDYNLIQATDKTDAKLGDRLLTIYQ
ncbi:glucose PTS transporter subunit IIA [Orbus wheelerorum]|uniref:glucose PTS transporter subunit IIA n=1 Tax=Orbus wheelerorum TaxID=3074111 RepID=UPI00370D3944